MATGGFATPNDDPDDIQMSDGEFKAVFDTAKELKIPVTAHVYGTRLMQKLIGFGITGMEHGSLMDKETAKMFEATGTYLVPTFCPYQDAIEGDEESMSMKSPEFCRKLHFYQERLRRGREAILESNIKLGYGTDLVAVHGARLVLGGVDTLQTGDKRQEGGTERHPQRDDDTQGHDVLLILEPVDRFVDEAHRGAVDCVLPAEQDYP